MAGRQGAGTVMEFGLTPVTLHSENHFLQRNFARPSGIAGRTTPCMEPKLDPQVFYDSSIVTRKSSSKATAREWRDFMSSRPSDMFKERKTGQLPNQVHSDVEEDIFKKIFNEVEELGVAQMLWKMRKAVENQKVVALGGKPPKNCKMSIHQGQHVKKKQERMKQKAIENEEILLGRPAKRVKKDDKQRKLEDRGLMVSEGYFKQGILHVKPLKNNTERSDEGLYRRKTRKGKIKSNIKKKKHKGKKKR